MHRYTTKLGIATAALMVVTAAHAASGQRGGSRSIDQTIAAQPNGRVEIENVAGEVVVRGWGEASVRVEGELGSGVDEVSIKESGGEIRITVELPRRSHGNGNADLIVHVPFDSRLDVETVSADIEVSGVLGATELQSVSGNVDVDGTASELEVQSVSGQITAKSAAELASGSFQTVSGDIEVAAGLRSNGRFEFESVSGSIQLRLPSSTGADIEAESFSGGIETPLGTVQAGALGLGREARFSVNGGGARVSIESLSGGIKIETEGDIRAN